MKSQKNQRIEFDHRTSNPNLVLAVSLSYNKPDTSYWNPQEPTAPYYRFTVIPTEVERNTDGQITCRTTTLLGGPGRKLTISNAPARFSRKTLEAKYEEVKTSEQAINVIRSVCSNANITLLNEPPTLRN